MIDKIIMIMAGGGAAGKSTTTKAFAEGEPQEFKDKRKIINAKGEEQEKWVHWTLYDNCASCGNHHSGTDSNTGPAVVREAFLECISQRDIIIIDGYTSSPRWIDIVNEWATDNLNQKVEVLCVHFKLSPMELLRRLANRRGVSVESIREKYLPSRAGVGRRGDNLVGYFEGRCVCPVTVLEIYDVDSTEDIIDLIDGEVDIIFNGDC